jgi:large subunit ribosomal protein L10
MMLIFQHNSVLAHEYIAIRRALKIALQQVDEAQNTDMADVIKLSVIRSGMFDMALRVVKFWDPLVAHSTDAASEVQYTHALSEEAYEVSSNRKRKHGMEKLLSGPVAILTIPKASPEHLRAALSILSPSPEFPAPKRRVNAAFFDAAVQTGIPKLMLLGASVESKVFDLSKVAWVGSIRGGLPGLRGQLVAMLQGVGAGVTGALESAGRSLHWTLEGRKSMLEEEQEKKDE